MSKIKCGYCKKEIVKNSKKCSHCGKRFLKRTKRRVLLIVFSIAFTLIFLALLYPYISVKYYFPSAQISDIEIFQFDSGREHGYPWAAMVLIRYTFIDHSIGLYENANELYNAIRSDTTFSFFFIIPSVHSGMDGRPIQGRPESSDSREEVLLALKKNTNIPNKCLDPSSFYNTPTSLKYYEEHPSTPPRWKMVCNCWQKYKVFQVNDGGHYWKLSNGIRSTDCID